MDAWPRSLCSQRQALSVRVVFAVGAGTVALRNSCTMLFDPMGLWIADLANSGTAFLGACFYLFL